MEQEKLVNFAIIKQKIIKTDEVLHMYKEANDKLKKTQHACKEIKAKYDQTILNCTRLQLENERCSFNFENIKLKYEKLEQDHKALREQKDSLEKNYNDQTIQSQLDIKQLEDEMQMIQEIKATADTWSSKQKESPTKQVTKKHKNYEKIIRELKESGSNNKIEMERRNLQNTKLCNEIRTIKKVYLESKDRFVNENNDLLKEIEKLKLQLTKVSTANYIEQSNVMRKLNEGKDEKIHNLQNKVISLTADMKRLDNVLQENGRLKRQLMEKNLELNLTQKKLKQSVSTQTDSALNIQESTLQIEALSEKVAGICCNQTARMTWDGDIVEDILNEMCTPRMLSPIHITLSEDETKPLPITNDIPDIVLTPPTPAKEKNIGYFQDYATLNDCVLEKSPENQENKEITNIDESLKYKRGRYREPLVMKDFIKLKKRRLKYFLQKQHALEKENMRLKRFKQKDCVLRAMQSLKRSNINFTISNESILPKCPSYQECFSNFTEKTPNRQLPKTSLSRKVSDETCYYKTTKYITEKLSCSFKNCCNTNNCMLINDNVEPDLLGFFNVKEEIITPSCRVKEIMSDNESVNRLKLHPILNSGSAITPEKLLETLTELVSQKLREKEENVPNRNRHSFVSDSGSEVESILNYKEHNRGIRKRYLRNTWYKQRNLSKTRLNRHDISEKVSKWGIDEASDEGRGCEAINTVEPYDYIGHSFRETPSVDNTEDSSRSFNCPTYLETTKAASELIPQNKSKIYATREEDIVQKFQDFVICNEDDDSYNFHKIAICPKLLSPLNYSTSEGSPGSKHLGESAPCDEYFEPNRNIQLDHGSLLPYTNKAEELLVHTIPVPCLSKQPVEINSEQLIDKTVAPLMLPLCDSSSEDCNCINSTTFEDSTTTSHSVIPNVFSEYKVPSQFNVEDYTLQYSTEQNFDCSLNIREEIRDQTSEIKDFSPKSPIQICGENEQFGDPRVIPLEKFDSQDNEDCTNNYTAEHVSPELDKLNPEILIDDVKSVPPKVLRRSKRIKMKKAFERGNSENFNELHTESGAEDVDENTGTECGNSHNISDRSPNKLLNIDEIRDKKSPQEKLVSVRAFEDDNAAVFKTGSTFTLKTYKTDSRDTGNLSLCDANVNGKNDCKEMKASTTKRKAKSKMQSNILRQVRLKRKMLQTSSGTESLLKRANTYDPSCTNSELVKKSDVKVDSNNSNKRIHIVQNILIPPNSNHTVDLLQQTKCESSELKSNCDIRIGITENSSQSTHAQKLPNKNEDNTIDNISKGIKKRRVVPQHTKTTNANTDVLSKILCEMDKGIPKSALKPKDTLSNLKEKMPTNMDDKEWRKGVIVIAESIHNTSTKEQEHLELTRTKTLLKGIKGKPSNKVTILMSKLLNKSTDENIPDEIIVEFKRHMVDNIAEMILQRVSKDTTDKPEGKYYPAPLMTRTQRILLRLMVRLEGENIETLMDKFLSKAETFLFNIGCHIKVMIPITRLYMAVCKWRMDIVRMRKFCSNAFYFIGDLAVPLLFTVLTSWTEVIPMESEVKKYPMAKILVQVVHLKGCNKPGYNLWSLRALLNQFYGYPRERWNCDEIFTEFCHNYLRNPDNSSDLALRLLCKQKDTTWVYQKINEFFKPLIYKIPSGNVNFKATVIILIGNICRHFKPINEYDEICLIDLQRFLAGLLEDGEVPELVKQSVHLSLNKLPKKGARKKKIVNHPTNIRAVKKPNNKKKNVKKKGTRKQNKPS